MTFENFDEISESFQQLPLHFLRCLPNRSIFSSALRSNHVSPCFTMLHRASPRLCLTFPRLHFKLEKRRFNSNSSSGLGRSFDECISGFTAAPMWTKCWTRWNMLATLTMLNTSFWTICRCRVVVKLLLKAFSYWLSDGFQLKCFLLMC